MNDQTSTTDAKMVSIRPGPSVLSVLRYLNYKPWFALAEFVDNALQSYIANADALKALHGNLPKLRVTIRLDTSPPGRITISDNAAGIAWADFPRAFRPAVAPPDAEGLSEFGMGMKSAACWFSSTWQVRTKALRETVERTVRFDVAKITRDELEELLIAEHPAPTDAHYTEITIDNPHHLPVGRTVGKIKEHLTDIYRVFLRKGILELVVDKEVLTYEEPPILVAPYERKPEAGPRIWRKDISFVLGDGQKVEGFAALRDPGNFARSGFALFRRGRLIEGSGEEGYRPHFIFGSSSSYRHLRLFGELHMTGFNISHTKDGFRWDDDEQPFLELLKDHLDSDDLPLLRQADLFRALASKKDRKKAAEIALGRTSEVLAQNLPSLLPSIVDVAPSETATDPLPKQQPLSQRELQFTFRGQPWTVKIELSDDPSGGDWLSMSDIAATGKDPQTLEIRLSMAHPFMLSFAQTDPNEVEAVLRIATALALGEMIARSGGVRLAGTIRRNVNDILREALSKPSVTEA
ncbi:MULTISPECIES: ATP-binding protein [Devosia]|uniref:ATP-binding protein n=1 Tax=Devosia TaxID=46913 RepID=UPI000CE95D03|nr:MULTISPECIES: ATP-binding protein [Devosia]AVF03763.1 ATP-binding protein [Devosia sp. I507]